MATKLKTQHGVENGSAFGTEHMGLSSLAAPSLCALSKTRRPALVPSSIKHTDVTRCFLDRSRL